MSQGKRRPNALQKESLHGVIRSDWPRNRQERAISDPTAAMVEKKRILNAQSKSMGGGVVRLALHLYALCLASWCFGAGGLDPRIDKVAPAE